MRIQNRVSSLALCLTWWAWGFAAEGFAATYHVSLTGSDAQDGAIDRPFRTIARAIEVLEAGDTCLLRAGRYREEVVLDALTGTAEAPITLAAYPGEKVTLDGCEPVRGKWVRWRDGIWRIKVAHDTWQLFSGEELVRVARWPNANFDDGSIWQMEAAMRWSDREMERGELTGDTCDGLIVDCNPVAGHGDGDDEASAVVNPLADRNRQSLAETGIDFTGAVAVLNIGHWITWSRPVLDHRAGSDRFTYDPAGTEMAKHVVYHLLGLPCLDQENEWWFDDADRMIFFKPPDGVEPKDLKLSGKVRDYGITALECRHVRIRGLRFFGCTFQLVDCEDTTIEDCELRYPATHKFMLGCYGWVPHEPPPEPGEAKAGSARRNNATYVHNRQANGDCGNVIRNCVIYRSNAPALFVQSPGSVVENCLVRETEWDLNSSSGSGTLVTGDRVTIRRNTIDTGGNSETLRPGPHNLVELNRVTRGGLLQFDGSGINVGTRNQIGTVVRYNWVHDTNRQGIRFDSTTSSAGGGGVAHHNVISGVGGKGTNRFKGDRHVLANLTIPFDILSVPEGYGEVSGMNEHTVIRNNLVAALIAWSEKSGSVPGILSHNRISADAPRWLRDPRNHDYRPRPGSPLVDSGAPVKEDEFVAQPENWAPPEYRGEAPDIGAYEAGADSYWIPGRQEAGASFPVPPDGASVGQLDADLMWLGGYRCKEHAVYIGTDRRTVEAANERSPEFLGMVENNIVSAGELESGKRYYWRVDAIGKKGVRKGKTWSFRVAADRKPVGLAAPAGPRSS